MIGNKLRAGLPSANAFAKGSAPWNQNLKGIHLSPGSEFKKGMDPVNRVPVGSVSIRRHRPGEPLRAYVKTAEPNTWRMRAVVVWESVNGPVPRGKVVHHKDRDALNDVPDNLEALTRAEHLNEHRNDWLPAGYQADPRQGVLL